MWITEGAKAADSNLMYVDAAPPNLVCIRPGRRREATHRDREALTIETLDELHELALGTANIEGSYEIEQSEPSLQRTLRVCGSGRRNVAQ
jgi:hypothetical protein